MSTASFRPTPSPAAAERLVLPWQQWSGPRVILLSTLGSALLALCFFAPRFWLWRAAGMPLNELVAIQPELHRAFHALQQLQDPWQRIDDPVNRVIEWRLLWPAIAHALGFSKALYFALPYLGCIAALAGVSTITWRATRDAVPTAAAAVLAATSSWFFVSTGWLAYFDSWLILGLLLASFVRARWVLFATALLTPWVDERFILALPLCLAVRSLGSERETARDRTVLIRDAVALVAGIIPYVAVRLGAEIFDLRATSKIYWAARPLLPAPLIAMMWGLWNGLRLGWVIVSVAALAGIRARRHRIAVVVIVGTLVLNVCVADDISRSASVATPALVAALLLAWRHRPHQMRRALPLLCLGNLVVPAQHVIAAPGTSVAFHCVPILAADAEFERARHPPDFANANTYTRRSMDHFQNRNIDRALVAAEIAVRFDPQSAKAVANRGIILYVTGKQAEGGAELDCALAASPELYDARMQRAAFRQQAGDLRGALDDVREALRYMPADWPRRNEAQQFERALAARATKE
jgi:hypothetical protein